MWLRGWLGLVVGVGIGAERFGFSLRTGDRFLIIGGGLLPFLSAFTFSPGSRHFVSITMVKLYNPRILVNHL